MLLIDANIFLELMLDQSRADECQEFLTSVAEGRRDAFMTDLTLDSILIVLENKGRAPSDLATFISSLVGYRGLRLYWLSLIDRFHATKHMDHFGLDFEDSATYQACNRLSVEGIVSFDRHFDGLPGLKRFEPKDTI
jgi:predicted nucleic acid-binding protein